MDVNRVFRVARQYNATAAMDHRSGTISGECLPLRFPIHANTRLNRNNRSIRAPLCPETLASPSERELRGQKAGSGPMKTAWRLKLVNRQ